ncbi:MAG: T9SS type A sorting domain-containing protein [Flavobacteriales bacterium]
MNRLFLTLVALSLVALLHAQKFAGGIDHTLAVCSDGTVMTWGENIYGQLGYDSAPATYVTLPATVPGLANVVAVNAGNRFSMALRGDGTVWSWGSNYEGELGNGTVGGSTFIPGQVNGLSGITAITGDCTAHALALKNDGTVWSWGRNYEGELGNGGGASTNVPVQAGTPTGIIAIAGGNYHSMALRNDGTVYTWGDNQYGQLGDGTNLPSGLPTAVLGLSGIVAIAAGGYHSLALKNDGTVYGWGYRSYGQLGDAVDSLVLYTPSPVMVMDLTGVAAISAGGFYSMALKTDGTVWTWGSNSHGELGNGSPVGVYKSFIPVQVNDLSGVLSIAAGFQHGLAMTTDGILHAWGNDLSGSLGDGNYGVDSNVPVLPSGLCELNATAVNEHPPAATPRFFPSPTAGVVHVEGISKAEFSSIRIHDVLGREVTSASLDSAQSVVDLSALPSGVYLITVGAAGSTVSTRVIKE